MNRRIFNAQVSVLLALAFALPSRAADTVFLELKGSKSGQIKGDVAQKGREGAIACLRFEQAINVRSGATTDTIVIRKRIDKSSPLLIQALWENQLLEARFKFWRPQLRSTAGVGSEEQFYTIEGKIGRVLSIKILSGGESKDPPMEEVTLSFSDLTWTYMEGGITYQIKK